MAGAGTERAQAPLLREWRGESWVYKDGLFSLAFSVFIGVPGVSCIHRRLGGTGTRNYETKDGAAGGAGFESDVATMLHCDSRCKGETYANAIFLIGADE